MRSVLNWMEVFLETRNSISVSFPFLLDNHMGEHRLCLVVLSCLPSFILGWL